MINNLEKIFNETVEWVNNNNLNISNQDKLKCYGYYKQALNGDNITKQPCL